MKRNNKVHVLEIEDSDKSFHFSERLYKQEAKEVAREHRKLGLKANHYKLVRVK